MYNTPMNKIIAFLLIFASCASTAKTNGAPSIMVSIKPFYNITAQIMHNVAEPKLLLKGNSSPHDYHLKPEDARNIHSSDLIVWGGPQLESFIEKSVAKKPNLNLAEVTLLKILPTRHQVALDDHHDHSHSHTEHDHNFDPHYWLDPDNAVVIANAIAEKLIEIDSKHQAIYKANLSAFEKRMNQKKSEWRQALQTVQHNPYIVLHDAYQYFEDYYDLNAAGAIHVNPEVPPSVHRIQAIQMILKEQEVKCIFSEPQFNTKVIELLVRNSDINQGILDPLGQDQDLGKDGYFRLIDNIVESFIQCNR